MKVAVFSTKPYDRKFFQEIEESGHDFTFLEPRLTAFPNVIITSHQGFFTREAMENIVRVTVGNITSFAEHGTCDTAGLLT